MSAPRRRRRYGLFTGKPKRAPESGTTATIPRYGGATSTALPQASRFSGDNTRLAGAHHVFLAEMPTPWTQEAPEHWRDQIPDHWQPPRHPVRRSFWKVLCLGSLGQTDMTQLWDECRHFDTLHVRRHTLTERNSTITVVVSGYNAATCILTINHVPTFRRA